MWQILLNILAQLLLEVIVDLKEATQMHLTIKMKNTMMTMTIKALVYLKLMNHSFVEASSIGPLQIPQTHPTHHDGTTPSRMHPLHLLMMVPKLDQL